MNKVLGKLIILIMWGFYSSLVYTAYNPSHEYLNLVDNASVLYLIVHIPLNLFFGLIVAILLFNKQKILDSAKGDISKKSEKDIEKLKKDLKKMQSLSNRGTMFVGTLFVLAAMTASFIFLGKFFLGTVMLLGFVISKILFKFIKDMGKEILDV